MTVPHPTRDADDARRDILRLWQFNGCLYRNESAAAAFHNSGLKAPGLGLLRHARCAHLDRHNRRILSAATVFLSRISRTSQSPSPDNAGGIQARAQLIVCSIVQNRQVASHR